MASPFATPRGVMLHEVLCEAHDTASWQLQEQGMANPEVPEKLSGMNREKLQSRLSVVESSVA
jgi:hypothetical protein